MHIFIESVQGLSGPSEAVRHGGGRRTKNLQEERERKGREGRKERGKRRKKREEKKERMGEESKRKMYCAYWCKTPPMSKKYKRNKKRGAEKS